MNDTVTQPRSPIARQLLVSVVILAVLGVAWAVLSRGSSSGHMAAGAPRSGADQSVSPTGRSVLEIETQPVRQEATMGVVRTTGLVSFPSDQIVKISPRLQGRIQQVLARVGDRISAGQTLAVMDSVDAASAQTAARQAENRMRLAQASLERQRRLYRLGTPDVSSAQAALDQARASAASAKDALERTREQARIGGFTQKPLEDAENALVTATSALSQARSDLAQAQRDHDRKTRLVEIGIAARADLEASQTALEKARVSVEADQEAVTIAKQAVDREQKAFKSNLYADQQVRQAESAYRQSLLQQAAADRALRLARAAILRDLQQAESDFQSAKMDAENGRNTLLLYGRPGPGGSVAITAPISGILVERNVNRGQMVDQSQMTPWQMFTINNTSSVWVDADIYEKDLPVISKGDAATIRTSAVPGVRFTGIVQYISPALDPKTHAARVRTRISNPGGLLKDGMYVEVALAAGRSRPALTVPLSAVQHDGDKDFVYVAADQKYVRRAVQLSGQRDGSAVVSAGLKPGERIVTHGALFLSGQASGG